MRRYASATTVPISRSRGEIDQLLRQWGCESIQWTDEFQKNLATLRFLWNRDDRQYMARFTIKLEPIAEEDILDGRTNRVSEIKREKAEANRGKQEHRLLLLWLKAIFNAVDAGIIQAETVFLPFLEDKSGATVAEILVPKLAQIPNRNIAGLLGT